MKKFMEPLQIEITENGTINITQSDYGAGEQSIFISPDQVPVLKQWLDEAVAELAKSNES